MFLFKEVVVKGAPVGRQNNLGSLHQHIPHQLRRGTANVRKLASEVSQCWSNKALHLFGKLSPQLSVLTTDQGFVNKILRYALVLTTNDGYIARFNDSS